MPQRGEKHAVVAHAAERARGAGTQAGRKRRPGEAAGRGGGTFGLPTPPDRIEVYDNSHIMGANPVGAMIVAGPEGFAKPAYRKFDIRGPSRRATTSP